MAVRKIIENFIGTSDRANVEGLGFPYSLNIMTEETGYDKSVSRVLKTVNGQELFAVNSFMTGMNKDIPIGTIVDALQHDGYIWLITENGLFRCKQTRDIKDSNNWECYIQATGLFTNRRYKHVVNNNVCFLLDITANRLWSMPVSDDSMATGIYEVVLPKMQRKYSAEWTTIQACDIAAAYDTIMICDKNSNRIYYSLYDYENVLTTGLDWMFVGYYDYDEKKVVKRENDEGTWFEQTAIDGYMRMLFTIDGTLYGVSTGYVQKYDYNSSTTEPFVPNLNGVIHLKYNNDYGYVVHSSLESYEIVFLQNDNNDGGLYIFTKDTIEKISTDELDNALATNNTPAWTTTMHYAPNHKLFAALLYDTFQEKYQWAVYDSSTKDWHWRTTMPWMQLGNNVVVFSKNQDWLKCSDSLAYLIDDPSGLTIIRQGGAIYNNGDSFIVDRCEIQTSLASNNATARIQYAWDNNDFNNAEYFDIGGMTSKCGMGLGIGRVLTVRIFIEYLNKPLIIRALKIAYRPANNFLGW